MSRKALIKNGIIIDGSGREPYQADLIIQDDKISEIGICKEKENYFDLVIDAADNYVTPGFIDVHSHTDLMNLIDGGNKPKIMQGVTTEVIGQCGLGVAPLPGEKRSSFREQLIIGNPDVNWDWESTGEYLRSLKRIGLESNLIPFTGHGVLRYAVKGDRSEPMNNKELNQLESYLEESFAAGIFGVSLGLVYFPAVFATEEELKRVIKMVSKYSGILAVHLRSEGDELVEALEEMISLTSDTDLRLHISHLKAVGKKNWPRIDEAFKLIEENHLTFDHYPYLAGSTTLMAIFPPFVFAEQGITDTINNLKDHDLRQKVKRVFSGAELLEKGMAWDNIPLLVGWEKIKVIDLKTQKNREFLGLSLKEIGEKRGVSPADAAMDLIIEEKGNVRMIDFLLADDILKKIMKHPRGMFGTDTLFGGVPHPRGYGTYPRVISDYVFGNKVLSLAEAVARMTGKPAEMLGLKDRGRILPDYKADLVIFNKDFKDLATYDEPECYPTGLEYVLINGHLKIKKGLYQKGRYGEIIKS